MRAKPQPWWRTTFWAAVSASFVCIRTVHFVEAPFPWAFREKAQRGFMQPRRDAIGRGPDLPITNSGAVGCCLLGAAPEVYPGSDSARRRFVRYPAPDLGFV